MLVLECGGTTLQQSQTHTQEWVWQCRWLCRPSINYILSVREQPQTSYRTRPELNTHAHAHAHIERETKERKKETNNHRMLGYGACECSHMYLFTLEDRKEMEGIPSINQFLHTYRENKERMTRGRSRGSEVDWYCWHCCCWCCRFRYWPPLQPRP